MNEKDFVLDATLKRDTFELGRLNGQRLLLMDNSLVPWFILVPVTRATELFRLEKPERDILHKNIDFLSKHLLAHFDVNKINIGAIGNIVRQLHIHIVGRNENDFAWPGVVWGRSEREPYEPSQVELISNDIFTNKC
jgi:diadenosine tetraphosphate (Ap4A) HIT family hydrolase